MPENTPVLKFQYGKPYHCELLYDSPKTGEGKFGTWYLYGMKHDNQEWSVFASKTLNERLERYRKGDNVVIEKMDSPEGFSYYDVIPGEGTRVATPDAPKQDWDAKTKDIHRQVCLKLAVQSMGTTKKDLDLSEVASRMNGLIFILDGLVEETPEETQVSKETSEEVPPISDEDLPF